MKLTLKIFEEGTQWVVVCLEHFIAAQGGTMFLAIENFNFILELAQTIECPKFEEIAPAPQSYWDMK